jgi:hypothetical protein
MCPASTEKTEKVLKQADIETGETKPANSPHKPRRAAVLCYCVDIEGVKLVML